MIQNEIACSPLVKCISQYLKLRFFFSKLSNVDKKQENVGLRNVGIKACDQGLMRLSQDQRSFHWGSNDRKLMTVPFDENPYVALAAWFKTDDGVEVYKSVEKQLQ